MPAPGKAKGFMGEFKAFIARGNVMDMAVGVIIGGAFGKISTSLVNDIIMPLISMLTGGIDFSRPVLLGYSGISDALLLKYIEDSRHIWEGKLKEIRYTTVGSVIGTHAGPGAVVVAFFKNQ